MRTSPVEKTVGTAQSNGAPFRNASERNTYNIKRTIR